MENQVLRMSIFPSLFFLYDWFMKSVIARCQLWFSSRHMNKFPFCGQLWDDNLIDREASVYINTQQQNIISTFCSRDKWHSRYTFLDGCRSNFIMWALLNLLYRGDEVDLKSFEFCLLKSNLEKPKKSWLSALNFCFWLLLNSLGMFFVNAMFWKVIWEL